MTISSPTPAYLVGQVTVRDPELWARYVAGVAESLQSYAAELVFRGRHARDLAGRQSRELVVVIRFADLDELNRWHDSDAYQALIPLRDRAADVVITGYET